MVGLERTVVPLIGSQTFGLSSTAAISSFVVSFGITKALTNLVSGQMADGWGRKRVLVLGWLLGLPVPFLIIWAPSWSWIVAANVLLGVNQGLAWSMTVIMKIDLVGPKQRGLAVGLNEAAVYIAVGLTAFLTGWIAASTHALRPDPFYLGIGYAVLGFFLSVLLVRDTGEHVRLEASGHAKAEPVRFREVFLRTSFRDPTLFAACQAGLVNNLNDGMSWAILPLFFATRGLGVEGIGTLKAVYPAIWGVLQTVTGPLSDRLGRKGLIAWGMWVQAAGLFILVGLDGFGWWLAGSVLLGTGTAMVYPTLLAAVSDASHPNWRARSLSVYRFWRDIGYAVGALIAGLVGDLFGLAWAIVAIGALTLASGVVVALIMPGAPSDTSQAMPGSEGFRSEGENTYATHPENSISNGIIEIPAYRGCRASATIRAGAAAFRVRASRDACLSCWQGSGAASTDLPFSGEAVNAPHRSNCFGFKIRKLGIYARPLRLGVAGRLGGSWGHGVLAKHGSIEGPAPKPGRKGYCVLTGISQFAPGGTGLVSTHCYPVKDFGASLGGP